MNDYLGISYADWERIEERRARQIRRERWMKIISIVIGVPVLAAVAAGLVLMLACM